MSTERRFALIKDVLRSDENATISADWTYTGTLDVSAATFTGLSSDDLSDVASIAMLDEAESVTGQYTFTQDVQFTKARSNDVAAFTVVSTNPQIEFNDTSYSTGNRSKWNFGATGESFVLRSLNDDGTNGVAFMQFNRAASSTAFLECIFNIDPDYQLQFGTGNSNIQYTKLTAGDCILDFNTIVQTPASDKAYTRFGRNTDCDVHYIYFNKGDGSTGTGMIYQYDNGLGTGYMSIHNGCELRVRDGAKFRIYDSTDVDQVEMYHNGTDFFVDAVAGTTTWIRNDGFSGTLNLASMEERWYDAGNVNSIKVEHDGTYANVQVGNDDGSTEAIKLSSSVSDHLFPGFQVLATGARLVGDDVTETWTVECDGGIYWIKAGSTTSSEQYYLNGNWDGTTVHTTISTNGSTHFALGAGVNPNIDGDHNIWFTNSGTTLNIKNRRGSSRYYCIYVMSGRS
jgi:hypothetical protein